MQNTKQKQQNKSKSVKTVATYNTHSKGMSNIVYFKDIVPPSLVTKLKYIVSRILNNAGFNTASIQLNANGVFDVDPSLASTAVPGFAEYATLYNKYRVKKVRSTCTFVNREAFPVIINLGFDRDFYSANSKTQASFESENQKTMILPANQSGSPITLRMVRTDAQMIGDLEAEGSANWANFVTGNPASLFFTSIAASVANLGAVFVLGLVVRWEVEFDVEFYDAKHLVA
jgi:hypothetical protein